MGTADRNLEQGRATVLESVQSALQVLLMFRDQDEVRLTAVSQELGVAKSTAHRLLATLSHNGFVVQDPASRAYARGPSLLTLATVTGQSKLLAAGRPHMESLARLLDETVNLLVLEGENSRFVAGVEGSQAVRVTARVGLVRPAHLTSAGKVLLAELDEAELDVLLGRKLPSATPRTITDPTELRREVAMVRRRGFALNIGESDNDIHAVGVPVRGPNGTAIAGLAVSVPRGRGGASRLKAMVPSLVDTASAIGAEL